MCMANDKPEPKPEEDDGRPKPILKATDVPLGDGKLGAAKISILSRRDRIRQALEDAGA